MKKINLLLLILTLSLFVTSCDKDEEIPDETGPITGELIGTWIGTDIDYSGTATKEVAGQEVDQEFVGTGYDLDFTATFESDPNQLTSEGTYSIEITTTIFGQSISHNEEDISSIPNSSWTRDGNELTFPINGEEPLVTTITELTDTTLKIKTEKIVDLSDAGFSGLTTVKLIYIYTKQ